MAEPVLAKFPFQVNESHLDSYGHMNHATYLQIFEQARWAYTISRGYGPKEVLKNQVGPTVLEVKIRYRRELRLGDEVVVESLFPAFSTKIATISQRMVNAQGQEAATIEVVLGLFDMKARKLVDPTPEWIAAFGPSA